MKKEKIEHNGVIESISGNNIRVHIIQVAACSACKAKSLCSSSESKDKYIDVYDRLSDRWTVGQEVRVCGSLSMGKMAVRLAFGIPVLIMVISLLVGKLTLNLSDGWSVLLMFLLTGIYFLIMYLLRDKISKKFVMWLEEA